MRTGNHNTKDSPWFNRVWLDHGWKTMAQIQIK